MYHRISSTRWIDSIGRRESGAKLCFGRLGEWSVWVEFDTYATETPVGVRRYPTAKDAHRAFDSQSRKVQRYGHL